MEPEIAEMIGREQAMSREANRLHEEAQILRVKVQDRLGIGYADYYRLVIKQRRNSVAKTSTNTGSTPPEADSAHA